jgi:hypothetical protein
MGSVVLGRSYIEYSIAGQILPCKISGLFHDSTECCTHARCSYGGANNIDSFGFRSPQNLALKVAENIPSSL